MPGDVMRSANVDVVVVVLRGTACSSVDVVGVIVTACCY